MFSFCTRWFSRLSSVGLLFGLLGCGKVADEPCTILYSDFEQFEGWVTPLPDFLTTERAHSGRYAYRLADGAEFGGGYVTTLAACPRMPRKLKLSAWVYLLSGRSRSTLLVLSVHCHGRRPDIWKPLLVDQVVKRYQMWEPVHKYVDLPDDLQPSDEVKVYVWHIEPSTDPTWFDDIKLEGLY